MKKFLSGVLAVILCLGCMFGAISTTTKAEDIKVTGKVVSGTTANLIKLNTGGSEPMLIKIDGNTNFSGCTSLLPNTELVVMVSYGSDAYWHAVSVKDANSTIAVTLDTSNPSTVVGVLSDVKSADTVVLKMYSGEMHLKLDPTTDYSAVRYIMVGKTYNNNIFKIITELDKRNFDFFKSYNEEKHYQVIFCFIDIIRRNKFFSHIL